MNEEVNNVNNTCLEELEGEEFSVEATVIHRTNKNFKAPVENTGNIRNLSKLLNISNISNANDKNICFSGKKNIHINIPDHF